MKFWRATKSQSQGRYQSAHSENGKMTESKTEKKTMWVKKVVEALGDSWNTLKTLLGYLNY